MHNNVAGLTMRMINLQVDKAKSAHGIGTVIGTKK